MYKYLLKWEYVSAVTHPECYYGDDPNITRDKVPASYWSECSKESTDKDEVEGQYGGLVQLVKDGELIRNVRLYRGEVKPIEWLQLREF